MVRGLEVTICQGMRSNLGDPPSIPSFYVYPAKKNFFSSIRLGYIWIIDLTLISPIIFKFYS